MFMRKNQSSWHVIFMPKSSCCFPLSISSSSKLDSNWSSTLSTTSRFMSDVFVSSTWCIILHCLTSTILFEEHISCVFSLKPSLIRVSVSILHYKRAWVSVLCNTLDSIKCSDFCLPSYVAHLLCFSSISYVTSTWSLTNFTVVKSFSLVSKSSPFHRRWRLLCTP